MKPGIHPTPTHLNELRGNPLHRTKAEMTEPMPELLTRVEPPDYLDPVAAREYSRVIHELIRLEMVTTLDVAGLALYAQSFADFWRLTEYLRANGETYETDLNVWRARPEVAMRRDAWKQVFNTCEAFGFSPSARARMSITLERPKQVLTLDAVLNGTAPKQIEKG